MIQTKICKRCDEEKVITNYYKYHKSKYEVYSPYCKNCHNLNNKEYNERNPEKTTARRRCGQLKFKYNLSNEEYNRLVELQNGICAICNKVPNYNLRYNYQLVIDHDHENSSVRSLLCHKCNQALGLFKDNIETIKSAYEYLIQHKKKEQ